MSVLIVVLPKNSVTKCSDEFSKFVLQKDVFSKCSFNENEFSLGPVFIEPHFTCLEYTAYPIRNDWKVLFKKLRIG